MHSPVYVARAALIIVLSVSLSAACSRGRRTGVQSGALRVGTPGVATWSARIELPIVPASAANLPDGKVLLWSANRRFDFAGSGRTYTVLFDPVTLTAVETLATASGHAMFCPGTTNLEDGRILVNGGSNSGKTSLYDPATGNWTAGAAMNITRGYNANTLLQDGSVLTLGGSWSGGVGNKHAEVWTESAGWRRLTGVPVSPMVTADARGMYRADNHMWLIPTADGRVLHAGPSKNMNWIVTTGDGQTTPAGTRGGDGDSMSGNAVMYDIGKILKVGGSPSYSNADASASAYVIDTNDGLTVRQLAPMAYQRAFHNSVVLPNGQVVVIGGQTRPVPFSDDRSVLVPELWDPVTETFTPMPPMSEPRNYHSIALLLPDGRVMSAGGGLCGACTTNHPDAQILTPPYLVNQDGSPATRPVIVEAPTTASYGSAASVTTDSPVAAFALVRLASTTHTVNNDQRRIPLGFQATGPNSYTLTIPSNPGIALPGAYMLFALDGDGVPSEATVLRLTGAATPRLTPPGNQVSTVGSAVTLALLATAPGGGATISFAATGLPAGLSLDAATGMVTGAPTAVGTYAVTLSAANGAGTVSTQLFWRILAGGSPRFVKLEQLTEVAGENWGSMAELNLLDPDGNVISRSGWQVNASSAETATENGAAANAIDGVSSTFWHTERSAARPPPPHSFVVDLGDTPALGGFRYLPRQGDSSSGTIARFRFYLSVNGTDWGDPVVDGDFSTMGPTADEKTVLFTVPASNARPLVTSPPAQRTPRGEAATVTVTASDPDSDPLTYSATGLPPGLSIDTTTGVISGTATTAGIFAVNVTVQDDRTGSATVSFGWTIVAPPTIVSPLVAPPALAGAAVTYTADASGDDLGYSWAFGDGSVQTPFGATPTVSHTYGAPGLYTVTLLVRTPDDQVVRRIFTQAVVPAAVPGRPASSSSILVESRGGAGDRIWVVNPDNDSVSVFDAGTNARGAEIAVGANPATLAVTASGGVWVVNRAGASISVIDPISLTVARTLALPRASRPFGIVFSSVDDTSYVSLEATGRVLKLDRAGLVTGVASVGPHPRHLAIDAAGRRLVVSRFITPPLPGEGTATVATTEGGIDRGAEVVVVNTTSMTVQSTIVLRHSDKADSTTQGRGVPNYLGAAAISPDGAAAWVPSKQDNVKRGVLRDGANLDFQNTVRAITSRIDLETSTEDHAARVDHDNSGVASAAAYHPSGAYLFVALETSRELAVLSPFDGREILRIDAGRAPQGLAVAPDGLRLYVSNFMDRTVGVFDLVPLVNNGEARIPLVGTFDTVATERLTATVLLGKQLFHDARDGRLARDGYLSCASCHRDGEQDGRTWDLTGFGEGLRNTISLRGRGAGHGPWHWSANFDEVQDFESQIRSLAEGTGLMSDAALAVGTRGSPLGDPKAGHSTDLDALAAYVASLTTFDASPHRNGDGTLTAPAVAGRQLFVGQCALCHGGAAFTSSAPGGLQNIGTVKPSSGTRLGAPLDGIDVPSLRDAWATAPYLHDGSAGTLSDAIAAHGGVTLTPLQRDELSAFVQQIGSEEPALARAVRARYVKLEELSEVNGRAWGSMAEFHLVDAAGVTLPRAGWTATANSVETVAENGAVANALDGNTRTFWHTRWRNGSPRPPHSFVVNLHAVTTLGGFRYLPRQTGPVNGTFKRFRFYVSDDGVTWGAPLVDGDFTTLGRPRAAKLVILP